MMRKIFGVKSISHLIYGLLMLAPILAIGVKCAYVVINKNAKDSFSNSNLVLEKKQLDNISAINYGETYYLDVDFQSTTTNTLSYRYYYDTLNIDWSDYGAVERTYYSFKLLRLASNNNQAYYVWVYYNDNDFQQLNIPNANMPQLVFKLTNINTTNSESGFGGQIYTYLYQQSKLDNVFYYAIDEIIQDNNFGKINFTGWFDNMMLDKNIQINQTYTHLFNWYLNYTLFISCAYILWLVLMWFVNFARKLLDRGMNYDW